MSFYRKKLYDAACTTVLRAMFRLIANNEQGFAYGSVDFSDKPSDFDVSSASSINSDSDWPKISTDNKVVFLDPELYGGTPGNPAFYIIPPVKNGWMALMDVVFPEPNDCNPEDKNILGIKEIIQRASDSYKNLDDDPRLFLNPDCDIETPFAKIHSRESFSGIEALIYATCRTYMTEHTLKTLPVFSKVVPSFENGNIDDLFFEYIAQSMSKDMYELSTSIGKRVFVTEFDPVPRFWLLFLEQCVQLYVRLRDEGKITPTEEEEAAIDACQEAQNAFAFPTEAEIFDASADLRSLLVGGASVASLAPYGIVRAFGPIGLAVLLFDELRKRKAKLKLILERKLETIQSVEDSCVVILKYFLKQESSYIAEYMYKELSQNEYFASESLSDGGLIEDLNKYFLNNSDFVLRSSDGGPLNIPSLKVSWAGQRYLTNPLDDSDVTIPNYSIPYIGSTGAEDIYPATIATIFDTGVFIFEKYVKITPKDESPFSNKERAHVNLDTFYDDMVGTFNSNFGFDSDANISDYFGDLEITTDEETSEDTLSGDSNGISYGLRISYMPPESLNTSLAVILSETDNIEELSELMSAFYLNNAYVDGDGTSYDNTNFLFPLVSVELDLPDMTISELDSLSSDDFDERTDDNGITYYDCLVSKLLNSDQYNLMFKKIVSLSRMLSYVSVHVNVSSLNSIGQPQDGFSIMNTLGGLGLFRTTIEDWDREMLPKTKKFLAKMFLYQYNSMDDMFEDGDAESERNSRFKELLKDIKMGFNLNLKWWLRRRQVDSVCEDDLGDLFSGSD